MVRPRSGQSLPPPRAREGCRACEIRRSEVRWSAENLLGTDDISRKVKMWGLRSTARLPSWAGSSRARVGGFHMTALANTKRLRIRQIGSVKLSARELAPRG